MLKNTNLEQKILAMTEKQKLLEIAKTEKKIEKEEDKHGLSANTSHLKSYLWELKSCLN